MIYENEKIHNRSSEELNNNIIPYYNTSNSIKIKIIKMALNQLFD